MCAKVQPSERNGLAAAILILNGRARIISIGTEYTTISFIRFNDLLATWAFPKVLAGVRGHFFHRGCSTLRTNNGRM
jgi:hypothetical protein|tara:strand:+ start:1499 stop:1729 length:231 start_codon:yes stop_codon:yes gene_type:complete